MSTLYQIIFSHPKQFCSPTTLCSFKGYKPWNKKDITTVGRGRKQIWPFSSWMLGNELWMQNEMPLGTTVIQVFKRQWWVGGSLVCTICDTCTYIHRSQCKFHDVRVLVNLLYRTPYTIYNVQLAVILIQLIIQWRSWLYDAPLTWQSVFFPITLVRNPEKPNDDLI